MQLSSAAGLADLSLEELSNIEVTSVSKRGQRLADVAGSVYVIRAEDIRRAGATTLPEALRLAPNLFVARADASQYAITARTGADLLANKMLVLVDGRTVYSPLFSGVFWEAQPVPLEDIERIEVLSGSGGTLYGSNAFHGVINVITRSARETPGTLVAVAAGTDQRLLSLRHGEVDDAGGWRVYARRNLFERSDSEAGPGVRDGAGRGLAGFRIDRGSRSDQFTVLGGAFSHRSEDPLGHRDYDGVHLLARHARLHADGDQSQLQAYVERFERDRTGALADQLDTYDLEYQRLQRLGEEHLLLWGAGWRHMHDQASNRAVQLLPPDRRLNLARVFAQDEWTRDRWKLTAGVKLERNSYTGLEWLPNLRAAWEPAPGQLLWAAWSRVVRTPARVDRETLAPPLLPSPAFQSERARITELGWRGRLGLSASASATLFHHDFDRLRSFDPGPGGGTFNNNVEGSLTGIEAWAEVRPIEGWRLQAGLVHQKPRYQAVAGTAPLLVQQGNDPRTRLSLQSSWNLGHRLDLFLGARYVSGLPRPAVPSYVALDARLGWHATPRLELGLVLRNINGSHVEWGAGPGRAEFGRSALLQATWRP